MMRELLETCFGKHYNSTKEVGVSHKLLKGKMAFADPKACSDCRRITPDIESDCDKVVLFCDTGLNDVDVIELEDFLNNFTHLKAIPSGRKCDLLLVDDEKIVFCDMTCSIAKYIAPFEMKDGTSKIGKRNTVRGQIGNSIALLTNVDEIGSEIRAKRERIALFAYREKPEEEKDDFDESVKNQMNGLNIREVIMMSETMYSDMGNGFLFTEIKYPNVYMWEGSGGAG